MRSSSYSVQHIWSFSGESSTQNKVGYLSCYTTNILSLCAETNKASVKGLNLLFLYSCNGLINEFQQEKVHRYQVNYIKEISNDGTVHLADARNVTLRTHRVNGALVEVSCNPFTEDSESQSNQVSHWDGISCESSSDFIIVPNDPKGSVLRV